jgi:hypothetical protein
MRPLVSTLISSLWVGPRPPVATSPWTPILPHFRSRSTLCSRPLSALPKRFLFSIHFSVQHSLLSHLVQSFVVRPHSLLIHLLTVMPGLFLVRRALSLALLCDVAQPPHQASARKEITREDRFLYGVRPIMHHAFLPVLQPGIQLCIMPAHQPGAHRRCDCDTAATPSFMSTGAHYYPSRSTRISGNARHRSMQPYLTPSSSVRLSSHWQVSSLSL